MNITNNTILITGGTSGIGLELAAQLLALGNTVIITGRDRAKLEEVKKAHPKLHVVQSDVSDPKAIVALQEKLTKEFPALNILINNAGIMKKLNLHSKNTDLVELTTEIETNLMGPVRMVKQFLPHLKSQPAAAIVNVSSGLAFVPLALSPVYCATKAGLHSFTQALRVQMKKTKVKIFELAPPGTETKLFRGEFNAEDSKGVKVMTVEALAKAAIKGFEKDTLEIRPGQANALKLMSRIAPEFGVSMLGKSADRMIAENAG